MRDANFRVFANTFVRVLYELLFRPILARRMDGQNDKF